MEQIRILTMIKPGRIIEAILIVIFLPTICRAQDRDFQQWNDLKIKADLTKKWELAFEQNIRFDNNASHLAKSYSNLSLGYTFSDLLKTDATYRFYMRNTSEGISYRHGFMMDVALRQKIDRFKLSLRNRFQWVYSDVMSSENGRMPDKTYRVRAESTYRTKKFPVDPYLSAEFFFGLPKGEAIYFETFRAQAGLEYEPSKHHTVILYWLQEWGLAYERLYVFAIGYTYSL